ncbi:MAG: carbohydrate porin [bacterium]|nr:carbohydrate porin [bacterium]
MDVTSGRFFATLFAATLASWLSAQECCLAQFTGAANCDGSGAVSCDQGASCDGCGRCSGCSSGDHCLWTSPTLTGDWFGLRSHLQESGVTFAGRSTHFAFGVNGGINSPLAAALLPLEQGNVFEYTGRGEYDLLFDLEKFGGLPYGSLLVRAEHWYGEWGNVSLNTGAFAPAVFPAALPPVPEDPGVPYITNFVLTQPLSEKFVVFAGKKDVLGAADQAIFAGGDGTTQFVNQALVANPAFLLALPYTSFTMGAVSPQSWGMLSTFIYDPKDRTKDFFKLDDLFADGIIVGAEIKLKTHLMNMPGEQHVGGIWKHVDLTDLAFAVNPPGDYPYEPVPGFATLSDSYTIYYGFDQYFQQFSGDRPGDLPNKDPKGWGVFGRASISDGNPTPIRYFLSLGIGGNSPVGDQNDNWGIGWYYVGASNEFGPIPQTFLNPQDGTGLEMFYNFQVNPWLNLSPDVQFIRPGNRAISDDAFVYGVRLNMTL